VSNPSPEWTDEERKVVAVEIAADVRARIVAQKRTFASGLGDAAFFLDALDRISFTLTASAGFLEANRSVILNGRPNDPARTT